MAGGASLSEIESTLHGDIAQRTLQYRLKYLVDEKRLTKEGEGRWAKYRLRMPEEAEPVAVAEPKAEEKTEATIPLSKASAEIREYLVGTPTAHKLDYVPSLNHS